MAPTNPLPSAEIIRAEFNYDPETGHLTYAKPRRTVHVGQRVASPTIKVRPGGFAYKRARVIWCWMTGEDPGALFVDHKNGDDTDDRWENLRKATPQENQFNKRGFGQYPKGVVFKADANRSKPWSARIRINGKKTALGSFATMEEAAEAYDIAQNRLHGEFSSKLRQPQKESPK